MLTYVEADREQALAIANWLREKGFGVEAVTESAATPGEGAAAGTTFVRLWTRAARAFWADRPVEQSQVTAGGLLLLTEEVELPAAGAGPGRVLDWQDWSRLDGSPEAERLLESLQRWREGGEIEPEPAVEEGPAAYSEEVAALLAEIDDPSTDPPRRLAIGDRLAELGDPRPGVGVVEIQVPVEELDESGTAPETLSPEVKRLLDEIDDVGKEADLRRAVNELLFHLNVRSNGVVYDADDHTFELIRLLRRFSAPEHKDEYPLAEAIVRVIPRRELLYLAALFLGVIRRAENIHRASVAREAQEVLLSNGLSADSTRLVGWLVEHNGLLVRIAERRDTSDPEVIHELAGEVADTIRLDYLYLLTHANARATDPQLWNSWNDALLRELYHAARRALLRGLDNPEAQDDLIQKKQTEALRLLAKYGV